MVGVPGRSKGCGNCRRKRKGCDRNLPSCHQCIGSGLVCGGYERDLVWVNATSRTGARSNTAKTPPWHARYERRAEDCAQVVLHQSLVQTAREQKYLGLFWSAFLPNGRSFSPLALDLSTGGWTGVLAELYESEPTLKHATIALSASVVGSQSNDAELRIKGLQAYHRAVREMGLALLHPRRSQSDGLLAAARFLELHEVLFGREGDGCPDKDVELGSWRQHNDGQLAILQMRGPGDLRSPAAYQLYIDGRFNAIIVAVMRKKRCIFSDRAWKTTPWEGKEKSIKDRLLDIMVDIPGLIEDYGVIHAGLSQLPVDTLKRLREQLLQRCWGVEAALAQWEIIAGPKLQVFDYTLMGSPVLAPKNDEEIGLLQLANMYWSSYLLLYTTIRFAIRSNQQATTTVDPVQEPPNAKPGPLREERHSENQQSASTPVPSLRDYASFDPKIFAYKIAHSVHLLFEPASGGFGGTVGLFPLGLALRLLLTVEPPNERSVELEMLCSLFDKPFMGSTVGTFLTNLRKDSDGS
ncbi:hypothetical protein PT974_05503 [Cladobotryum mycophilum]|uniref:Zn(2)-C6 fungal-type domain-containing protein n=1 Tax=Cladobotryum mycophilum TaxID=491253 RepID=A0ABR0SK19_9HYPO